jgi:hypothetical protein
LDVLLYNALVSTTPHLYNVTCTNANKEYSQVLPTNTKKIILSVIDGTDSDNLRISYETGKVATPTSPYKKYSQSIEYSIEDILYNGSIYFASSLAGVVVQIECWS